MCYMRWSSGEPSNHMTVLEELIWISRRNNVQKAERKAKMPDGEAKKQ
eukprot:gene1463-12587_t